MGRSLNPAMKSWYFMWLPCSTWISLKIFWLWIFFVTWRRAWKILYFVKMGGDYVPATSLVSIDQNRLVALLSNFTTSHNQRFQLIKEIDLQHSYRNAFSVYFTSKVAVAHFFIIQQLIVNTWQKSTGFYLVFFCVFFGGGGGVQNFLQIG